MTSLALKSGQVLVQRRPRQTISSIIAEDELNHRLNSCTTGESFGPKLQSNQILVTKEKHKLSDFELKTYVLKLLEDLESNVNNDNFGKTTNELIADVCNCLKGHGSYLDEDMAFREQMDGYFNLLRNILRNQKLDRLSRAFVLEVIELRASDWTLTQDVDAFYRNKISDLELNDSYSLSSEMSRGLKTSQSSGSIMCSSVGNEIVKSSGKFVKPTKVPGKAFLKDEVVIRNGDSGKVMGIKGRRVHMIEELSDTVISFQRVNPGAKERLVQITGPSEENIERAKELIENTIKRNASPVPFECSTNKSFDSSLNQFNNEIIENETFETSNTGTTEMVSPDVDNKMPYSFTVNVGEEMILLSTKNYSIGYKAMHLLDKYLNKPLEEIDKSEAVESHSNVNSIANKNEIFNKTNAFKKDVLFSVQRPSSATRIDSIGNNTNRLQRSSSQGNVPIGRTSLRFLKNKSEDVPECEDIRNSIITYDREFLMSCANSPLSQNMSIVISEIANKLPDILRDNGLKQSKLLNSLPVNNSQSASNFTQNNTYEQW